MFIATIDYIVDTKILRYSVFCVFILLVREGALSKKEGLLILDILEKLGFTEWWHFAIGVFLMVLGYFAGAIWTRWRERQRHRSQEFPDAWIVQRNIVDRTPADRPILQLRTFGRGRVAGLTIDPELARKIEAAASNTSVNFPGVRMPTSELQEQLWGDVINAISPLIPKGAGRQLVAITREVYPEMMDRRQRNIIRILTISEEELHLFRDPLSSEMELERPVHDLRRDKLLPWMARLWFDQPGNQGRDLETGLEIIRFVDPVWS